MVFLQRKFRRWFFLAFITLGPVFLVACGGGGGGGGASAGTPAEEEPNPYLPTEEYVKLFYNISPFPGSFLPDKKNVGSVSVDVFVWPTDTREYFVIEPDSIAWRGLFSPSMFITRDGAYSGDIQLSSDVPLWSESMLAGDYSILNGKGRVTIKPSIGSAALEFSGYRQFHGIESVTVPLGTFDAVHVSYDITISFTKQGYQFFLPFSAEYWFVEGMGIVKRIDNGYTIQLTNFQGADRDSDGVADVLDLFPDDGTEATDNDHDGTGDNGDADDDNDGVPDSIDALPFNSTETKDNDRDGVGDIADANDDNDTAPDVSDAFPFDRLEWLDTDGDGTGNNADTDDDGDGWSDALETACLTKPLLFSSKPVDTDVDGTCDVRDTDDDNDGYTDGFDAFPVDAAEWLDTDKDGTGNNGDADDDNDTVVDTIDPQPLDPLIPGVIYSAAPVVMAGESVRILLSGARFSAADTFYVDGVETEVTILNRNAAEFHLQDPEEGDLEIAIRYDGLVYESHVALPVVAPVYYPYSVIAHEGRKDKSYFDPLTQSLFVYNTIMSGSYSGELTRFRYSGSGAWEAADLELANMSNFSVSPDRKHLAVLRTDNSIIELGMDDFSPNAVSYPDFGLNPDDITFIEFDYANRVFLAADWSYFTYGLDLNSPDYHKTSEVSDFFYSDYVYGSASNDGSFMLLATQNNSYSEPLAKYNAISPSFSRIITARESASSSNSRYPFIRMNMDGSRFIVNGYKIYNSDYLLVGQLSKRPVFVSAVVIDRHDRFVITAENITDGSVTNDKEWKGVLHFYDTSNLNGQVISPVVDINLNESIGIISSLALSSDGLTLFVMGEKKTLVVPVWQIRENAVGSNRLCPAGGCGDIKIADGMRDALTGDIIVPVLDDEPSTINVLWPRYAGQGNRYEIILTGTGFKPASVAMFNETPAETRYVNQGELRVMIPDLPVGDYQVTVDGHRQNAPYFKVLPPSDIGSRVWAMGGKSIELIHDPLNNALYNFDINGQKLTRINLADDSMISVSTPVGTKDMTWCHGNGSIFLVNGADVFRYDSLTLNMLGVVSSIAASRIECVFDNNLFLTSGSSSYPYVYDANLQINSSIKAAQLSSPVVDGVALAGDKVYLGEKATSYSKRILYNILTKSGWRLDWNSGSFLVSSWSDSGKLGVVNNSVVYNGNFEVIGLLSLPESAQAAVVSPDGTRIYAVGSAFSSALYEIVIDPENPTDFSVDATYSNIAPWGTINRMEVSHDGNTVFISNSAAIVSAKVH